MSDLIYTPDAGFTGLETITYTIRDSGGLLRTGISTVRGNGEITYSSAWRDGVSLTRPSGSRHRRNP